MTATTIRMIHVACRDLGLDQDTRHELQERVTGKASLSDMTERQLKLVVDELKAKGWSPMPKGKAKAKAGGKVFRNFASRGDVRFCHVLWGKLVAAGTFTVPGHEGLNAFARTVLAQQDGATILDVDQLRDHKQIALLIEVLKNRCARAGVVI